MANFSTRRKIELASGVLVVAGMGRANAPAKFTTVLSLFGADYKSMLKTKVETWGGGSFGFSQFE